MATFAELAAAPDPALDELTLALAAEFREVDADAARARLDDLGAEVTSAVAGTDGSPGAEAGACAEVLGGVHGFAGDRRTYDDPRNSMLDLVLRRRKGLPILLGVVYVEVARRAGVPLAGVGLPGHFVVGHFGGAPPLLLDPFAGGGAVEAAVARDLVRPWRAAEIAMRMLNNLVGAYTRRGQLGDALRGAELRLALPAAAPLRSALELELRTMRARLN